MSVSRATLSVTSLLCAAGVVLALGERNARLAERQAAVRLVQEPAALKYELGPDPERAPPRTEGPRVAALGDSVTHGAFVPGGAAWPSRLATALSKANPAAPASARNWAAFGYDAESVAASYAARARAEAPDVVVYGFYVNDAMPTELISAADRPYWVGTGQRPFVVLSRALDPTLHRHSALFRRAEGAVAARALEARGGAPPVDWDTFARALDVLVADTRADCVPLVAIAIPPWPLAWAAPEDCTRVAGVGRDFCAESFAVLERGAGLLRARGVTVVDGLAAYRAGSPEALAGQPGDPHHPSAEGHARLATALVEPVAAALAEPRDLACGSR